MRKTKETREILTEWRNFEKNNEKQILNEIDLSTVFQSASELLATAGPYLATLGGTIAGSAAVGFIFDTIKYKLFTRKQNLEAFKEFVKIVDQISKESSWNGEWVDVVEKIGSKDKKGKSEIDKWVVNNKRQIRKHFKEAEKVTKTLDRSDFYGLVKADVTKEIKSHMSSFNAKDAIKKFDDLLYDEELQEEIDKLMTYNVNRIIYNLNDKNFIQILSNDAKRYLFIDATLLTMLEIYNYHLSGSSKKFKESFEKISNEFSEFVEIEEHMDGNKVVTISNDASLECIMAYANLYTSEENKNSQLTVIGSKGIETTFIRRAEEAKTFKERTRALRDVLKFVKRAMMTTASGGLYLFIQAFIKEFAQDEVLSEISEQCQDYLDSKSDISDTNDVTITEFVKAIIAVLLE